MIPKPPELFSLITQHAGDLLAGDATDAAIAVRLKDTVIETRRTDPVTQKTLLRELTSAEFNIVMTVLDRAADQSHYAKAIREELKTGLDFADPDAIEFIGQLRPAFVQAFENTDNADALAQTLLDLGVKKRPLLEQTPLEGDVRKAREWKRLDTLFTEAVNRARALLESGSTWAEAVGEFDLTEAA